MKPSKTIPLVAAVSLSLLATLPALTSAQTATKKLVIDPMGHGVCFDPGTTCHVKK